MVTISVHLVVDLVRPTGLDTALTCELEDLFLPVELDNETGGILVTGVGRDVRENDGSGGVERDDRGEVVEVEDLVEEGRPGYILERDGSTR